MREKTIVPSQNIKIQIDTVPFMSGGIINIGQENVRWEIVA